MDTTAYQDVKVNDLVNQLKQQLSSLDDKIKKYGIFGALLSKLAERKSAIQDKLNEIADKNGILTNEELYDLQILAANEKTAQLKAENDKTIRNLSIITGSVLVTLTAVYLIFIRGKK